MQIKQMPTVERPQEKMMFAGAGSLSNSELLALIIRTGTSDKSAIRLAEDVLAYASEHTGDLSMADARELTGIDGIGTAKACSIVAAMELSKRIVSGKVMERASITDCDDVAMLLMEEMGSERRELFMSIHLNTRLKVESKAVISIGCLDSAPVHPREVFNLAIRRGAAAVIVAHNHPTGDPTPSEADIAITARLLETSRIVGIKLIDHVIIGNGDYVSLRKMGYIPEK